MKLAGIILIVIGVISFAYQGISYTMTKKDAQIGPIVVQHDETHTLPLPPIVGSLCLVGGIIALGLGNRNPL